MKIGDKIYCIKEYMGFEVNKEYKIESTATFSSSSVIDGRVIRSKKTIYIYVKNDNNHSITFNKEEFKTFFTCSLKKYRNAKLKQLNTNGSRTQ